MNRPRVAQLLRELADEIEDAVEPVRAPAPPPAACVKISDLDRAAAKNALRKAGWRR